MLLRSSTISTDSTSSISQDTRNVTRIGIFGGTFDPIHIGHLILAEEAWSQLQLDRIYLVPAGDPPHKRNRKLTPAIHRLRMLQLAIADIRYLKISRIDVDRPGPHYTVDMVRLMRQKLGDQVDLYFLMGMDSLRDLPTWYEAQWLIDNCKLVALSRHDVDLDWTNLEHSLPNVHSRVIILDMPELEIASHTLQERVRAERPIRHQVPREVEEYIFNNKIYQVTGDNKADDNKTNSDVE